MSTNPIYLTQNDSRFFNQKEIEEAFKIKLSKDEFILFSEYVAGDNGSGEAWIIISDKDKLYEIHGSESSVHDMHEQWDKEETSWEEIFYRINNGGHQQYSVNVIKNNFSHLVAGQNFNEVTDTQKNKINKMDQYDLERLLMKSGQNEDLNMIKYLLTTEPFSNKLNIHAYNESLLQSSCGKGNVEIASYLLTSPDLKEHANIYELNGRPFQLACASGNKELVNYLIFDYKVEQSKVGKIDKKIKQLFTKRDLIEKLENDLPSNPTNQKSLKI